MSKCFPDLLRCNIKEQPNNGSQLPTVFELIALLYVEQPNIQYLVFLKLELRKRSKCNLNLMSEIFLGPKFVQTQLADFFVYFPIRIRLQSDNSCTADGSFITLDKRLERNHCYILQVVPIQLSDCPDNEVFKCAPHKNQILLADKVWLL